MRRYDLHTLEGTHFLNDKIVNQYLELVQQRNAADPSLPSIYALNTFVYEVLDKDGLEKGETRMDNWFHEDLRKKIYFYAQSIKTCIGQ